MNIYMSSNGAPSLENRKEFAVKAFHTSSHYDTTIFNHFNEKENLLKLSINDSKVLRYG